MVEENNEETTSESVTHKIEISDELYQAITQLKQVLQQMTGQEIQSDEEVIWILVSWFIESIVSQQQEGSSWQEWDQVSNEWWSNIIV